MPLKTNCDNCGRGVAGIFSSLKKKDGLCLCPTCYKDLNTMECVEPPVIGSPQSPPRVVHVHQRRGGGFMRFLGWCFVIFVICPIALVMFLGVLNVSSRQTTATSSREITSATHQPAAGSPSAPAPSELQLLLLNWTWHQSHSHAIAEGQVKNTSSKSLKNVQALVEFYTADNKFISSDDALLDYTTLLPGQTSPFKVIAHWNPEMNSARINFKTIWGSPIDWKKQE